MVKVLAQAPFDAETITFNRAHVFRVAYEPSDENTIQWVLRDSNNKSFLQLDVEMRSGWLAAATYCEMKANPGRHLGSDVGLRTPRANAEPERPVFDLNAWRGGRNLIVSDHRLELHVGKNTYALFIDFPSTDVSVIHAGAVSFRLDSFGKLLRIDFRYRDLDDQSEVAVATGRQPGSRQTWPFPLGGWPNWSDAEQ
ncbi:hypothetical protein D3C86_1218430 [compost metagenome]